uniref:KIAA1549 n=1 Tax=Sphenodon punctatus TaxID=8508 RepID=A0A8D0GR47_SPHPU
MIGEFSFYFFLHSSRAKRSPKQRRRHQINGSPIDADKDRLITTDSDGTYKRPPGVNNSAYISDPDLPAEPQTPSPADIGKFPGFPSHTVSQYIPPQPSIEEARQTMHSLLDDAFALVAPSSQAIGIWCLKVCSLGSSLLSLTFNMTGHYAGGS